MQNRWTLCMLTALALCVFILCPPGALAAQEPVTYIERSWNGSEVVETEKTISEYTEMTSNMTTLTDGWYVVKENRSSSFTFQGTVNLILMDGARLNAWSGIKGIKDNRSGKSATLNIYGQAEDSGKLISSGSRYSGSTSISGISDGIINIHGGIVEAKGDMHNSNLSFSGAGISGTVTIYGGSVKGTGSYYAAGIGSRYQTSANVTIYGGTVTGVGGAQAAGIGGGGAARGNIAIYGGTVHATGGFSGAGIGSGCNAAGGTITIEGGSITAKSTGNGAGIGSGGSHNYGEAGNGGSITIKNSVVAATSAAGGAGIGGGGGSTSGGPTGYAYKGGAGGTITIEDSVVTAAAGGGNEDTVGGAGIGGGGAGMNPDINGKFSTYSVAPAGEGGTITIRNSVVTATGGGVAGIGGAAGIGGGGGGKHPTYTIRVATPGEGGTVVIENSVVTAIGSDYGGAGIGGGGSIGNPAGTGGSVTITGGKTTAEAGIAGGQAFTTRPTIYDSLPLKIWHGESDETATAFYIEKTSPDYPQYDASLIVDGDYYQSKYVHIQEKSVVSFDGNDHTSGGPVASQYFIPHVSFTLPPNTFVKENLTFAGWNTKADGTGTSYSDQANVSFGKNDVLLYAQWIDAYTVNITPGANMTKTQDSGAQSQAIEKGSGNEIEPVVYTADDGYFFPADYSVAEISGVSVTRSTDGKRITVSGNPTSDVNLTLPAAAPIMLTGSVAVSGTPQYGEKLTAAVTDSNNTGELRYQWNRDGQPISGANGSEYTTTADDIGKTISVTVTSTVQQGSIASDGVVIEKASAPDAPAGLAGVKPSMPGASDGKITGADSSMEYSADGGSTWQPVSGNEISGLPAGDYLVRYAETATHDAGVPAAVTVPPSNLVITPLTIVKQPMDQSVVAGQRAEFSIEATGDGLTYEWYISRDNGNTWEPLGCTSASYVTSVTKAENDGYQYVCWVVDQYQNTLQSNVAVLHVFNVPALPETGDSSAPMLYLAMCMLGMLGIVLMRKRNYSK